jgi:spermidine synthase
MMIFQRNLVLERLLLALFVASGFAGLIYQAIWSHYLGLSLGHAAYAQTLVLGIFMGGMALGAWLVSRYGIRWQRLIYAYAIVEILIGVGGLFFHPVFEAYTSFSQQSVYPALSSPFAVHAWQWGSAALLIAPQSILLGMTFPLMSGGYLRIAPRADGEILGGLYFTNSIGAAFGALFSTFVLLPRVGMPGSVATAGAVNLIVGLLAWMVSRRADVASAQSTHPTIAPAAAGDASAAPDSNSNSNSNSNSHKIFFSVMLLSAAITGASSFVYEIGWVRLLNQSLGTTIHSFELMLSAFILGLAFGGLWIRKRSQSIADPVAYAGYAQILMGAAALISIPVFSQSFVWVGALMEAVPKTDDGYTLFSLGSAGIAILVMFPAAFFAGMTLPLFTMAMLRRNAGEASIGRIYAANTLGAIVGVMLAVHLLIPVLGLRLAITLAALADIALGFFLLHRFANAVRPAVLSRAMAATLLVIAGSLFFGKLDPRALASGVFRHSHATLGDSADVLFLRDGKTATIAFFTTGTSGTIATNGKPDASIQADPRAFPNDDEITMIMAASLPLAAHPDPKTAAVIGWGSGLTTHSLLGDARLDKVDSIEIERAIYEGAKLYGRRVARGYADPRSNVYIDDARTFFSAGKRGYDIIISEPSNPWVSGVAALFTHQFYRFLRGHLNEDGVAVQWLQSYELNDALLATMLAALTSEFPYVDAYLTNTADLLFLASDKPLRELDMSQIDGTDLRAEMKRVGLGGNGDFVVRKIGNKQSLQALVTLFGAEPHSDYFPVVSLNAPRARFKGDRVQSLSNLTKVGMPLLEMTGGRQPASIAQQVILETISHGSTDHWNARDTRALMLGESSGTLDKREPDLIKYLAELRHLSSAKIADADINTWLQAAAIAADFSIGYLPSEDHQGLWIDPQWIAPSDQPAQVQSVLASYSAAAKRDGPQMQKHAIAALGQLDATAPNITLEHMLIIAMLGAISDGNIEQAMRWEKEYSTRVRPTNQTYTYARIYLMAWADLMQGK